MKSENDCLKKYPVIHTPTTISTSTYIRCTHRRSENTST